MIAIDTNVLVRFLVEDDRAQTRRAQALFAKTIAQGDKVFIPDLVLVETVWVLSRSYRVSKREIVTVLKLLIIAQHVQVESKERVQDALKAFERGKGGFADCLIREIAYANGCSSVATFDKDLLKDKGFIAP